MKLVKINEVKPNPKNPRTIRDDKFQKLVKSIQDFPQMLEKRPLVCFTDTDGKYVVLGGNMRLKASKDVGLKELPIILADDWTEEEKAEFLIKDNVGFGEWDWDQLTSEWDTDKLDQWGLDLPGFDLNSDELGERIDKLLTNDNNYSRKIEAPTYQISGEKPLIKDLYNVEKYEKLLNDIEYKYDISEDIKKFLIVAASRHIVFNYANIAEFYAHSNKDVQDLMEDSALVIIDFNKAIENGFVKLSEEISNQYLKDYED